MRQHLKKPWENCLEEAGEKPGYVEALKQRAGSLNMKRLLLIKESQITQVKEFRAFLYMGRCKILGSMKWFLWYVPQLSGASFMGFHILRFLSSGVLGGSGYSLDGRYSPFWLPSGFRAYIGGLQSRMTVTSLFTDTAGNSPFLRCMAIFFFK